MKKKKISFPSALTVLFIVLIFAAILTAVVPAGLYSKLTYNADYDVFEITTPEGEVTEMAPTQESLDELGVTGNLNKFLDGSISKPIAVPGTYERVDQEPQGVFKILLAAISGVYDTIDIILFVFILGGCIGVLNYMGAFNAAIAALSKVTKRSIYRPEQPCQVRVLSVHQQGFLQDQTDTERLELYRCFHRMVF